MWLRLCISGEEAVCNKDLSTQHQNGHNQCLYNNVRLTSGNTECAKCGGENFKTGYQNGHGVSAKSCNGYNRSHYANLQYSSGFDITGCKKSGITNTECHHSQIAKYGCIGNGCHCGLMYNEGNFRTRQYPTGHQSNLTDTQSKHFRSP